MAFGLMALTSGINTESTRSGTEVALRSIFD
jgi:hypothetical protein